MPSNQSENLPESDQVTRKKSRLGVRFFFTFLIFYMGFVLIGVFNYDLLSLEVFQGINLAIVYGIALIFFAVLLGILYNFYCTKYEDAEISDRLLNKKGGLS